MNAFSKRYFVWISLIFIVFSMLSFVLNIFEMLVISALIFGVSYLIFCKFGRKKRNFNLIFILLACASLVGTFNTQLLLYKNDVMIERFSGEHTVSGYVLEVASSESYHSEVVVHIENIDGEPASFDTVIVADFQLELARGDFFECRTEILALEGFEGAAYLRNKNPYDYPMVCLINEGEEIEYLKKEFRFRPMLADLNSRISATIRANMDKKSGSLAGALLLGNRELLSDDTLRDFKRAGVYHMLALSGLHVAMLIGIFELIMKKLLVPSKIRMAILAAISLFYISLTGFLLSACRSMLMLWVMYLSLTLGRKRDAMTSLFVAVTVICLISPAAILDIGFQLSVLSTFGIISASIIRKKLKIFRISKKNKITNALRELLYLLVASLCVFVFTLPVISVYFGEVSLATFFTNLFMGALCECFMVLSLITLCFSKIRVICSVFSSLAGIVCSLMNTIISWASDIEGVMLSLEFPNTDILVFALFFTSLLLLSIKLRRKWLIFAPCVAFAILFAVNVAFYQIPRKDTLRAEYLAADEIVLSSSDGVYICDMSRGGYGWLYESVLLAKENCFTEIDGIVLTHYHSAHTVSLQRLAKNYKIRSVLLPMPKSYSEGLVMQSIVRVLAGQGVKVCIYETGDELDILGGKLEVSDRAYVSGASHPSVALSFAYGESRLTLVGGPYFNTYLEESRKFEKNIINSDYIIFSSEGNAPKEKFEIFKYLTEGCEVSFADFDMMNMSDFENYLDEMKIYFDVEYKKYDLK